MFIKICGLSTEPTLTAAVEAGADAVGFVFAPGSPRFVTSAQVAVLLEHVPASVETVGVFRNQPVDEVIETAQAAGVRSIQFHGNETQAEVERARAAGFEVLRAYSAEQYLALDPVEKSACESTRILLDAVEPGAGETFDPELLAAERPHGFWLLAGGLTPDNVADLAWRAGASGVDVSSGVESSRGVKSSDLIKKFVAAARNANVNSDGTGAGTNKSVRVATDSWPATAEALMRSRFEAFRRADAEWLLASWHPDTRPRHLDLSDNPAWRALQIVDTEAGQATDDSGVVEFRATYRDDDGVQVLHERSNFVRVEGRWLYRDGVVKS